jgi:multiple sugar transport system permease protein
LPNATPALATSFIFCFVWVWGDWLTPLIYLTDANTTLAVKINTGYVDPKGNPLVPTTLAGCVLYTLPLIIMFFLGQKYIVKGVVTSGLKG